MILALRRVSAMMLAATGLSPTHKRNRVGGLVSVGWNLFQQCKQGAPCIGLKPNPQKRLGWLKIVGNQELT